MTTGSEKMEGVASHDVTTTLSVRNCWDSKRTPLERTLLVISCVMATLCAVLVFLLVLAREHSSAPTFTAEVEFADEGGCATRKYDRICVTEDCVKAAAEILENMDPTVEPCEDFYTYACGRWNHLHELPPDRPYYDTFSLMKDGLKTTLRELLEKSIDDNDCNATIKAKKLYASCMNESAIEMRGEQPLVQLLQEFGGWPVISSNWSEDEFEWVRVMAKLKLYSSDALISQLVGPDIRNSSLHIIQIDQSELGLPSREYYVHGTEQMEAYLRYMIDIAVLLGAPKSRAQADMEDVLDFETAIANISVPNEERRNYTAMYNKMTLQELQEEVPQVNWMLYFNIAMPLEISETEEIVVYALQYLKDLGEILEITPKRVLANYLLWRFVSYRVGTLDKRFLQKQQEYFGALYGTQTISPRWKTCINFVNNHVGMAVGSLFVRAHFNQKSKEKAEEMIEDIRTAFLEILNEVDWMDDSTRKVAKEKAEMMNQKIGFPEYLSDPVELDKDYDGVEFDANTYFENVIAILKHSAQKDQMKLRTAVDKTQWVTSPAVVNAYYTRSKNFISFPAGILQPPLYHQNYPRSLNYGGIGVVIGHEITHGYDDKGRQFDQHGNLRQWWNEESLNKFHTKAQCIVDQYSDFAMPGTDLKVNGFNTQGENIADNGGVKQAFRAYRKWEERHGEEDLLPGLNLTHHQLFFLKFAQIWCGVIRPEAAVNAVRTGTHSPGRFRVIGTLSNSVEFSETFRCPAGSPMNPKQKCHIW